MNFLQNILSTIIGFFIALGILFLLIIVIGAGLSIAMGSSEKLIINSSSILELDLSIPIKDYAPKDESPLGLAFDFNDEKLGLNSILNAIENAKTDSKIKGISIKNTFINAGIAQTQAIRNKLNDFKVSGKFIYAYNDVYSQKNYYLSSVADSLFLNPVGAIDFKGLSTEVLYFKDFEDKYGVKMEVIRHGKYKSAVEPFLQNEMSDANREQTSSFLKSIWSEITSDIQKNRGISIEKLNEIANNSEGRNATLALKNNLIDAAIYQDEYDYKLTSQTNSEELNLVTLQEYISSGKGKIYNSSDNTIAVIYAQGEIKYGEGDENYIGQKLINEAIIEASLDDDIKAIVLRVNSPGGSALASELIWRELAIAKQNKPIVVSMGNLAASGGYYISCVADKIIAEPTTITGSIGVFGAMPNAHKFATNIGINAEQVSTNNGANYSAFEPITEKFYKVTKESVEDIYDTFLNRVAEGRNITIEEANEIAQGRVWTGKEALSKGLVDGLGGLDDAISESVKLADLSSFKIKNYPNYKKDFKDAFKGLPFVKTDKESILKETLGVENYQFYKNIEKMKHLKGIQARVPYLFEIN